jgi:hypothetical protein
MAALRTEFERRFPEVLTSRAVIALRVAADPLDPHSCRRPERDSRSPPRGHQRHLDPDTERLPRRPGGLRRQLESHHTGQPSRRTRSAGRRTGSGQGQPRAGAIRRGEDNAFATVRGSYRSVCHRCSPGSPGVDPEPLEQFSAENTARLAPSLAWSAHSRARAIARSTSRLIPLPALCRPPTSHWRAGAHVDVGRPHQRLDQPLWGNPPTLGLALRPWCDAGPCPTYHRCQPHNRGNHS